ncbi:MAG TPA: hypothetical protein VFU51_08970 [Gaiellaceae bacterium]|nr:hypothetical protein [Gaiellaceae bacterium]
MIDRLYGDVAGDGRDHPIRLLDELNVAAVDAGGRSVDAGEVLTRQSRQRSSALSRR